MSEKALCRAVAGLWAHRRGFSDLAHEYPDQRVRHAPAVDLLARNQTRRALLVMEHTMVESFPGQRTKQLAANTLFRPLEELLAGKLPTPGRYDLVVDPGRVLRDAREGFAEQMRQAGVRKGAERRGALAFAA